MMIEGKVTIETHQIKPIRLEEFKMILRAAKVDFCPELLEVDFVVEGGYQRGCRGSLTEPPEEPFLEDFQIFHDDIETEIYDFLIDGELKRIEDGWTWTLDSGEAMDEAKHLADMRMIKMKRLRQAQGGE